MEIFGFFAAVIIVALLVWLWLDIADRVNARSITDDEFPTPQALETHSRRTQQALKIRMNKKD